jgi:peptidyl-prolyl cis-trans isomerase SurA
MQRQIWNRSTADSTGLKKYFETHEKNYWWKPGAEAIIFNVSNLASAKKLSEALEKNINNWRKDIDSLGGQIQADSGRFELKQIPGGVPVATGRFTEYASATSSNKKDNPVQFAYIIHEYAKSSPRTFGEARGLVINDYQNELENKWVEELKKKYPVTINETVFRTLPK